MTRCTSRRGMPTLSTSTSCSIHFHRLEDVHTYSCAWSQAYIQFENWQAPARRSAQLPTSLCSPALLHHTPHKNTVAFQYPANEHFTLDARQRLRLLCAQLHCRGTWHMDSSRYSLLAGPIVGSDGQQDRIMHHCLRVMISTVSFSLLPSLPLLILVVSISYPSCQDERYPKPTKGRSRPRQQPARCATTGTEQQGSCTALRVRTRKWHHDQRCKI